MMAPRKKLSCWHRRRDAARAAQPADASARKASTAGQQPRQPSAHRSQPPAETHPVLASRQLPSVPRSSGIHTPTSQPGRNQTAMSLCSSFQVQWLKSIRATGRFMRTFTTATKIPQSTTTPQIGIFCLASPGTHHRGHTTGDTPPGTHHRGHTAGDTPPGTHHRGQPKRTAGSDDHQGAANRGDCQPEGTSIPGVPQTGAIQQTPDNQSPPQPLATCNSTKPIV